MRELPTISVLMSTYNTPKEWLSDAIESILNQTFSDFEFIIVDDCSVEGIEIFKSKYKDSRIIWMRNEKNLGLTKTLNKALKVAKGKYIARMDADDISLPMRFQMQVDFMEKNPDIIACGSYRRAFGNEDKDECWNIPRTREEQQIMLFFYNCGLTHPTAMFRKEMLDKWNIFYNENYTKAQDYGIWVQCTRYAPLAMIPKVLLQYRKSNQQISVAGRQSQLENDRKVKIDQLEMLGIKATEDEKDMHVFFCRGKMIRKVSDTKRWVERLKDANNTTMYFDQKLFSKILNRYWYECCKNYYKESNSKEAKKECNKISSIPYKIRDIIIYIKRHIIYMIRK